MKYNRETAQAIADVLATGDHTIAQVCQAMKIAESTFFKWKAEKSEFSEFLKKAEVARRAALAQLARAGLATLLVTTEVEETTIEYVASKKDPEKPQIKSRKVTKRKILPHATAVVFALKNLDSENFKDKHEVEHSGDMAMTWNETKTYAKPADGTDA